MIIKSSTALRNDYGTISDLAHDEGEPIYITKNGEGDLVVMSIEAFEQREEALKLRAKLEAAETAGSPARPPIPWRSPERGWRGSIAMAELVILEPAQRELEEIAQLHMNLVGPASARRITDPDLRHPLPAGALSPVRSHPSGQRAARRRIPVCHRGEVYLRIPADGRAGLCLSYRLRCQQLSRPLQAAGQRRSGNIHRKRLSAGETFSLSVP